MPRLSVFSRFAAAMAAMTLMLSLGTVTQAQTAGITVGFDGIQCNAPTILATGGNISVNVKANNTTSATTPPAAWPAPQNVQLADGVPQTLSFNLLTTEPQWFEITDMSGNILAGPTPFVCSGDTTNPPPPVQFPGKSGGKGSDTGQSHRCNPRDRESCHHN